MEAKVFEYKDSVEVDNRPVEKRDIQFLIGESDKEKTPSYGGHGMVRSRDTYHKTSYSKIVNLDDVLNDDLRETHSGYLKYLKMVYTSDAGYVIKPDFIWFTILSEISKIIKADPEGFRKYFSNQKEKHEIEVFGDMFGELPIDLVTKLVFDIIPSGITENMIVPKFSTLTDLSEMAFKTTFLDAMSEYFNYSVMYCGFSKVKIYGTTDDYLLMNKTLTDLSSAIPELQDYIITCKSAIDDIITNWDNKEFWHEICWTEQGYATHTVDGWFTKFYANYNGHAQELTEYKKHVSKVNYKVNGSDYTMYVGIFTSTYEDGCYVPEFNKIICSADKEELAEREEESDFASV